MAHASVIANASTTFAIGDFVAVLAGPFRERAAIVVETHKQNNEIGYRRVTVSVLKHPRFGPRFDGVTLANENVRKLTEAERDVMISLDRTNHGKNLRRPTTLYAV